MVKRSDAAPAACTLCIILMVAGGFCPSANAQSADLVLCDRIAADPADPDKPADVKGTAEIAQSDIATAIKFCKTASASSRRALYELGRAYAANRQMAEAMAMPSSDRTSADALAFAAPGGSIKVVSEQKLGRAYAQGESVASSSSLYSGRLDYH